MRFFLKEKVGKKNFRPLADSAACGTFLPGDGTEALFPVERAFLFGRGVL